MFKNEIYCILSVMMKDKIKDVKLHIATICADLSKATGIYIIK
jgi:hypothetical protein